MQLVITTAQIPGHAAPLLIDRETLGMVKPGSVIVGLAAETGGNCEVTRLDETITDVIRRCSAIPVGSRLASQRSLARGRDDPGRT
jgi:NAD/NADP transhydrogenase alpha subunit